MSDVTSPPLTIDLSGPGRHALLTVVPPVDQQPKPAEFDVAPLTAAGATGQLVRISTQVIFTTAVNERDGWRNWHVKIYRCAGIGDAAALRQHLHRQAAALQRVNSYLPATERRQAFQPPWAVVPVQVVRGDGQLEELAGAVTTRLGVAPDQIVAQLRQHLPPWLGGAAGPEQILLAVSPEIDALNWENTNPHPATEHLATFATLAAGLDHLHQQNWAHCDIKPDNVCRCTYGGRTDYVLIDTDAATRADPAPQGLRSTERYQYRGLRELFRDRPGEPLQPGHLYAQDRFGFLTVVLSTLAGRAWVDQILLADDPDDPFGGRIADHEETVARALAALWQGPRWQPLIEVLAEPFGTGVHGQAALERPEPWAAAWLERARAAEARCVDPRAAHTRESIDVPPPAPLAAVQTIERIRTSARVRPATRHQLVRHAYEAIERGAGEVAVSRARLAMWVLASGLTTVGALVGLSAFVAGR